MDAILAQRASVYCCCHVRILLLLLLHECITVSPKVFSSLPTVGGITCLLADLCQSMKPRKEVPACLTVIHHPVSQLDGENKYISITINNHTQVQRVIDGCEAEKKQPLKICAQSMCLAVETKSIAWFFRPCQDMPSHQTTHVVPCFSNVRRVPVRVRGEFFSISFL